MGVSPSTPLPSREPPLVVRNVVFPALGRGEGGARYDFYDGNALCSTLFVLLSAVFPDGERFFVATVRERRSELRDASLRARAVAFAAQESLHGREHDRLNEKFRLEGFDVELPARVVRRVLGLYDRLDPRSRLACTIVMEHVTAHLAEQWLVNEDFRAGSRAETLELWSWHALEELEHKSVAFDVYAATGGTLARRRVAGALVLATLIPALVGT